MEQIKEIVKDVNAKAWLRREIQPYRGYVSFLAMLSIIVTLFSLSFAYLVRFLINSASNGKEKELVIFSAIVLGVLLLKIILKTVNGYLAERLRTKMYTTLRAHTFSKILRSDYASIHEYHSGELLNRLTTDVQEICVDTVGYAPTLAGMIVQCLGAIAALLTIDPIFTLIYIVCGGIFGAIAALFRRQIKRRHKEVLEADGKARAFMQEGLGAIMTLKAYGAENRTDDKVEMLSKTYYTKRMKRNALRSQMNFVFTLLSNFGLIFAVIWCSVSVLNGNDDYGSILSVILLLMQLQTPLTSFSSVIPVYYSRMASAERLMELDEIVSEEIKAVNADMHALYDQTQAISLKNLSFSYDKETTLDDANIAIKKGEIVCLTGSSGSGKSTIFKLLLSVFHPTEGEIILEGTFGQRALTAEDRKLFAYVPQGNFLFSGTIYENLAFFADSSDRVFVEEEIRQALTTACAEFVYDLPDGLNTRLAEGGEGLSEGQLQRLTVARAILTNRPILLLDEATSALDGETEQKLLENIRQLKNKTCLIVTHRPAALEIADRILLVENKTIHDVK